MNRFALAEAKGKLYHPELDAIRGFAFLVVFVYHASGLGQILREGSLALYAFNKSGPLAIETFFVLSSFLLTWLALNEVKFKGRFSIRNYFVRRILRIWPLYFVIMILGFVVVPYLAKAAGHSVTLPDKWYYLFFVANFYTLPHVYFLQFLWSISVEEQFYLIWGIFLKFFIKHIRWIALAFMIISVGFTTYRILNNVPKYFHTLNYFFDFACGAFGAYSLFYKKQIAGFFSKLKRTQTILFYLALPALIVLFYFLEQNNNPLTSDFAALLFRYCFIIYIAMFIIEQMSNPSRVRIFGKNRFLIFTGRISYGLYCFHGLNITLIGLLAPRFFPNMPGILLFATIFIINYAVAWVSYVYYELPFLKLKSRWKGV